MQATLSHGAIRERPEFTLGYRPSLDGLRAIGVLLVMGTHSFIAGLIPAGNIGLMMFFVLSGFLITVLLLREWQRSGTISLRDFYARRALRLLPALIAHLAVTTLVVAFTFPDPLRANHYRAAFSSLFYFFNWAYISGWVQGATVVGQCWSLSVEEQFYLLWPLTLLGLLWLPIGRRWKMALIATGIVGSWAGRLMLFPSAGNVFRLLMGSDMHIDGVLIGCLLGLAACWGMLPSKPSARLAVNAVGLLAFAFLVWNSVYPNLAGYNFESAPVRILRVSSGGLALLCLVTTSPVPALRLLEWPPLVWIGRRSYGIYLWHLTVSNYLVIYSVVHHVAIPKWVIVIVSAVLGVGLAAASFRFLETPLLHLKMRFSSEPAAAVTVLAQTAEETPARPGTGRA